MIRVNLVKSEKKDIEDRPILPETTPQERKKKTAPRKPSDRPGHRRPGRAWPTSRRRSLDSERGLLADAQAEKARLQPVVAKLELLEQQKVFLEKKIGLITEPQGAPGRRGPDHGRDQPRPARLGLAHRGQPPRPSVSSSRAGPCPTSRSPTSCAISRRAGSSTASAWAASSSGRRATTPTWSSP